MKFPSANWSVPMTLSAMDLGMSSGLATSFVAEFCGVPDRGKSNVRASLIRWFARGRILIPFYATFRPLFR
jgi:hypothetical protein